MINIRPFSMKGAISWVVFLSLFWFGAWFLPWQKYLHSIIWLQLGLSLILFIIPGACLYGLISGRPFDLFDHITFGFVISHLILAVFGTLGRAVHFSFGTLKLLTAFTGLIIIFFYMLRKFQEGFRVDLRSIRFNQILPLILIFLTAFTTCLIVIQRVLNDDDLTYLAYVTNWQNAAHLDFNDIIFGQPDLVHPRFWIMSAPFAHALLSDLSKTPGILVLSGYYESFLVLLASICTFRLARAMNFSQRAAVASSILQPAFLLLLSEYLHPGAPFFRQLSADKATAAYIVAPVMLQGLIRHLKNPTRVNFILFVLVGFSLMFMHPVILAYALFISGVLVLFNWRIIDKRQALPIFAALLIILLPQVFLRFVNVPSQSELPFTSETILAQSGLENMIQRWGDTQFYGFNPSILDIDIPYEEQIPLSQPIKDKGWLVLPILSVLFTLSGSQKRTVSQYILACFLLALLAGLPFTGWIIGYFLTAYMLERAVWLFPFGISTVFLFLSVRDLVKAKGFFRPLVTIPSGWLLLGATIFSIGTLSLYMRENVLPDFEKFTAKSQRYRDLAIVGQELDKRISDQSYVIGSPQLNDMIPGISSKAKLITFRISSPSNMLQFFPNPERLKRIDNTTRLFANNISPDERLSLLDEYDIRFLVLQNFDLRLFDEMIRAYPDRVTRLESKGVIVLQISEK